MSWVSCKKNLAMHSVISAANFLKWVKTLAVTPCGLFCVGNKILANLETTTVTEVQQIFPSIPKDVNND